jgi:hypothetical protein
MDFYDAMKTLNKLLIDKRPATFNSGWIRKNAPHVYRFIQKNVRAENKSISKKSEVAFILNKYNDKLYAFITPADKNDEHLRDMISISLVRIAQKGNIIAKEEIIKLVRFTIDEWVEHYPTLSSWQGYEPLIQKRIEGCIRCYRYSGSFIRYLFKTLEYAGRGLRPITAYSLDNSLYSKQ